MDVLSQIMLGIRLRQPLLTDLTIGEGARIDMGDAAEQPAVGMPFYYVVKGAPRFTTTGNDDVILSAGECLLIPHWDRHFISTGQIKVDTHILDIVSERGIPLWSKDNDFPGILQIFVGSDEPVARVLCGIFSIEPSTSRSLFGEKIRTMKLNARDADLEDLMRVGFDIATRHYEPSASGFSALLCKWLELIFVQSTRHWLLHAGQSPHWVRALTDPRLRRAIEAIHACPAKRWSLVELARTAGQSRSRFAEAFRRALNLTPFEYIKRCRNHLALDLLARHELSVADIAEQLGYSSASIFTRNFAEEFGETPGQYRRRAAQ